MGQRLDNPVAMQEWDLLAVVSYRRCYLFAHFPVTGEMASRRLAGEATELIDQKVVLTLVVNESQSLYIG